MGKPEKCGTAKRGEKMFCIIYIFTAVSYALSSVLFWLVLAITPLQDIRHPLRLLCFPARFFFWIILASFLTWFGLVLSLGFLPPLRPADVALINKLSGVLAASVIRHGLVNQHRTQTIWIQLERRSRRFRNRQVTFRTFHKKIRKIQTVPI